MVTFVSVAAAIMSPNMLTHYSKAGCIDRHAASAKTLVWWLGQEEEPSRTPTGQDDPSRTTDLGRPTLEVTFQIARDFGAPLDEILQYPNGDD